jgi:hypothetical protein
MPTSSPHPTPQKRQGAFFHTGGALSSGEGVAAEAWRRPLEGRAEPAAAADTTAIPFRSALRSTDDDMVLDGTWTSS